MSVPPNGLTDRRSAVRILVSLSRSLSGALQPFRGTQWYLFCQCQELWRIYRISTIVVQLEDQTSSKAAYYPTSEICGIVTSRRSQHQDIMTSYLLRNKLTCFYSHNRIDNQCVVLSCSQTSLRPFAILNKISKTQYQLKRSRIWPVQIIMNSKPSSRQLGVECASPATG